MRSPTERVREMGKMVNRSHVLVVPLPGAGHINPMLQFSRRLVSKGLKVTFVITEFISKSRQLGSSIGSIQLDTISDGYDDGFNQTGSWEPYLSSLHDVGPKTLSDLIKRYQTSSSPIHAVIYEPFLAWALDVAKDFGLFAAAFFTHACAVDYIFYSVYHEVLKVPVSSTPVLIEGLPLLLELQDLPTFVVLPDSYPANVKMIMSQFANMDKADLILINTYYKLECEVVDRMSKVCPLLTIGPTIPSIYLDKSIEDDDDYGISLSEIDASLSINWLSTKPTASVVYVSFGSCATLSSKQMEEIAWGLKRSNFHFLWVVMDSEKGKIPEGFVEEVENKGLLVNWSPQVKVLANEAVGCFLTHCGWNSTIEALSLGVPMVTMPGWSDQQTNSKLVEDAWKVGVRAKVDEHGIVKREEIALCIKEVMEGDRGREMKMNSKKWKELAIEATSEVDVARNKGIECGPFFTRSCAVTAVLYHAAQGAFQVPVVESDQAAVSLASLENSEFSDLPSFVSDAGSYPAIRELLLGQFSNFLEARWLIWNNFNELEVVNWMRINKWPIRTIGPMIPSIILDKRLGDAS